MDESVIRAMAKWPNVPAVYGWLSLDRHGQWRLKGALIKRRRIIDFIGRNYDCDKRGRWFFQNGPQRVFVDLDYTPWVYRLGADRTLETHVGEPVHDLTGAWLDERDQLLLVSERGVGIADGDALFALLESLEDATGQLPAVEALEAARAEGVQSINLRWGGRRLPLQFIESTHAPGRFGFIPKPRDEGGRTTPG